MGSKILIVDDEPAVLGFMKELLIMHNYDVEAFTSAAEALEAFQKNPAQYPIVITDQTMPNILGIELIQQMQRLNPVKAILCTGYSESLNEHKATELGVSEFLAKPFNSKRLVEAVEKLLR